jgi:curved DNA-binding protein CbpA
MKLNEALYTQEAKKKWRELVMKYHPDTGSKDEEKIKRINNAKDEGDDAINKLYDEIVNGKTSKKYEPYFKAKQENNYEQDKSAYERYQDFMKGRENKEEKQKETAKQQKAKVEQWLKQPEFVEMFNKEKVMYILGISESNKLYIIVKAIRNHHNITLFIEDIDLQYYNTQERFFQHLRLKIMTENIV